MCYNESMREPSEKTGRPVGGQPKFQTPEAMGKAIDVYFEHCAAHPVLDGAGNLVMDSHNQPIMTSEPPTISGLCYHIGFLDRNSFYDYHKSHKEFSGVLKNARLRIEAFHERRLSTADKCTGSIFWLKNHDWYDNRAVSLNFGDFDTKRLEEIFKSKGKK